MTTPTQENTTSATPESASTTPSPSSALFIDASTLEGRFCACPREYQYHALEKREKNAEFAGRNFGKFFHRVMAQHRREGFCTTELLEKFYYAECPNMPIDDHRTIGYGKELYKRYFEKWTTEPFSIVADDKTELPFIEHSFAIPLGSIQCSDGRTVPIVWTGVLDLATLWPNDGSTWVVDLKTSIVAGETFWAGFTRSIAQVGYCWAQWRKTGVVPAGYMIDAVFTRKDTKTGKGMEFERQKYPFENALEAFKEWEFNTLSIIAAMFKMAEAEYFPMTGPCVRRYGACEFLEVCRLPSASRAAMLRSNMYKDVTWNPLDQ